MNPRKEAFIRLALECKVLQFGEFTLKSGRISPYFFNMGLFYQASALQQVGQFYADTLVEQSVSFQHLFGCAYKGISLAAATAIALTAKGLNPTITFNRKEAKGHGEGGLLIGAPLNGNTVIIDDVISAGTSFREAQHLIKATNASITAVLIGLDRCERGQSNQSALQEIQEQGIPVFSIINLYDLLTFLKEQKEIKQLKELEAYQKTYGLNV